MTKTTSLIIHQTLHGYKDGHALLASSIDLSIEDKKEMSKLSDYSGSGDFRSFSEYYTAYPLQRHYAFAKTWYAGEMPRPGTVWTHTLLLEQSTLWLIRDIKRLLELFQRPGEKRDIYSSPIEVNINDFTKDTIQANDEFYIIASKLYTSDNPLILLAITSKEYEDQIFKLWVEQWPRMRRTFSFCTGSLSPRLLSGKYLDLQVMPFGRESSLSAIDRQSVDLFDPKIDEYPVAWKDLLKSQDINAVRKYMTEIGADITPRMKNFDTLLDLYNHSRLQNNTAYYTEFLLSDRLRPSEGLTIKNLIVKSLWSSPQTNKIAILKYLFKPENQPYWDIKKLITAPSFLNTASKAEFNAVLQLVQENCPSNELVDILKTIPADVWIFNYELYSYMTDQLFPTIQDYIFTDNVFLKLSNEMSDKWIETALVNESLKRKELVHFLLKLSNDKYSLQCYEVFGSLIVSDILNWVEVFNSPIPHGWKYIIRENLVSSFINITNLKVNEELLSLIFEIWSPIDKEWSNIPETTFISFLLAVLGSNLQPQSTAIYTYFLTSCMYDVFSFDKNIVQVIFQPLHDNLEQSIYERTTWQRFHLMMAGSLYDLVESDFFSKHYWDKTKIPDWDRCELLRRSLIACFFAREWPAYFLTNVITKRSTFRYLAEFCNDIKPLKKWLKPVMNQLEDNGLNNTFYFEVLKKIY